MINIPATGITKDWLICRHIYTNEELGKRRPVYQLTVVWELNYGWIKQKTVRSIRDFVRIPNIFNHTLHPEK